VIKFVHLIVQKKSWEPRTILETYCREYVGDLVAISIGDKIIDATGGHPFWVLQGEDLEHRPLCDCLPVCDQKITLDGRWGYARDLRIDDVVRSHSFDTQKISALELSMTETIVYNFLVDDLHNYAVGENEVLVHNTNSPKSTDSFQNAKPIKWAPESDKPIRKQLEGKGQIKDYRSSKNLEVGNVSLKHCVGDSRLAPVDGRKWENQLNHGDLSAKGHLPKLIHV
jgi:hypothetical protein